MSPLKPPTTTRREAIHEPLNKAQAYINAVIEELREHYPQENALFVGLTFAVEHIDQIQHDFEDKMLTEEAGI